MTVATVEAPDVSIIHDVIIKGDLARLSPEQRASYYVSVCQSIGLNPLTKPFEYISLNGKLVLYAQKGATDQLRGMYKIGIGKPDIHYEDGLVIVTVTGRDATGREDSDVGAVALGNLQGEARANAVMKAITKAKRRLTLSMCGLGMLDELEVETIPNARRYNDQAERPTVDVSTGEIIDAPTQRITATPAYPIDGQALKDRIVSESHDREAQREDKRDYAPIFVAGKNKGLKPEDVKAIAYKQYQVTSMTALTGEQLFTFNAYLNNTDPEELAEAAFAATTGAKQ